ncbi:hypothetical protein JOF53_004740 [Crossiella equi]|uniref:Lipoprotein n=1 Tax=Crossiella equi TaxID=130796 RepID=A0ABS5AH14_9PSEU|nr:hypothetical protein [Crossiella equi]MBP2475868.1 hypothetical protein [Crossiella equi]
MSVRLGAVPSALLLLVTACTAGVPGTASPAPPAAVDAGLVAAYFTEGLAAARAGTAAQQAFLRRTQHPDFREGACELGDLVLLVEPVLSTLRPDPEWPAGGRGVPRGRVYVVAVSVTARRADTTVGNQVGSQHVVVLDSTTYGFAPCPRSE